MQFTQIKETNLQHFLWSVFSRYSLLFCYLHYVILQSLTLQTKLQQSAYSFYPVVPFKPDKNNLLLIDFTSDNKNLSDEILNDTNLFTHYINHKLKNHNALYGIGGYNEHRTIYTRSNVFSSTEISEEPRRLHLGIDIWGQPGTPVFAPLGGVVHSFAFNDRFGDYGATVVLLHQLSGTAFHTLYGHLGVDNLTNLEAGKYISIGEQIGTFGEPFENGNWPPHLHFQIIKDMEENKGDYPGVCAYSQKEKYLQNCPDPDYILNMMQYATTENTSVG